MYGKPSGPILYANLQNDYYHSLVSGVSICRNSANCPREIWGGGRPKIYYIVYGRKLMLQNQLLLLLQHPWVQFDNIHGVCGACYVHYVNRAQIELSF